VKELGRLAVASCFASLLVWSPAQAAFTQILVFGDSLSDDGNAFVRTQFTYPPTPPYAGHFSNGPVAVERLASDLGVSLVASAAGGTDYAVGGATTGTGNYLAATNSALGALANTGITAQVTNFKNAPPTFNPSTSLFVVWGGPNDFFLNPSAGAIAPAITNLSNAIDQLWQAGARDFLVPNMVDLSLTPFGRSLPAVQAQGLHELSIAFDGGLADALAGLRTGLGPGTDIFSFDTMATMNAVINNPGKYGFSDVTDACVTTAVCSNPNGHLFWDMVHPTAHGAQILGDDLFAATVPEPQTYALLLTGLLLLAIVWCRRLARSSAHRVPLWTGSRSRTHSYY
jgi:phospholipase/lecithinase/hemolysin